MLLFDSIAQLFDLSSVNARISMSLWICFSIFCLRKRGKSNSTTKKNNFNKHTQLVMLAMRNDKLSYSLQFPVTGRRRYTRFKSLFFLVRPKNFRCIPHYLQILTICVFFGYALQIKIKSRFLLLFITTLMCLNIL